MPDTPRPNYVHDESAKGSFYVRNSDNEDNNFTCEYAPVHFRLQTNRQPGDVYLNADWTYDRFCLPIGWNTTKPTTAIMPPCCSNKVITATSIWCSKATAVRNP